MDGKAFFIHGLIHDSPLVSISREFKGTVNEKLENLEVICEDGFAYWIKNAVSFEEIKHFGLNKTSMPGVVINLVKQMYYTFILRNKKREYIDKFESVRTIDDLKLLREGLFKNYLPEPEGMNQLISKSNGGSLSSPRGEFPLRVRRYIYEAQESIRYARSRDINELHIAVGCAHELPLEYFLSNPSVLNGLGTNQ